MFAERTFLLVELAEESLRHFSLPKPPCMLPGGARQASQLDVRVTCIVQ
jgi:hypothetical protein